MSRNPNLDCFARAAINASAASDAALESNTSRRFRRELGRFVSLRDDATDAADDEKEEEEEEDIVFCSSGSGAISANDKTRTGAECAWCQSDAACPRFHSMARSSRTSRLQNARKRGRVRPTLGRP